MRLLLDTHSLIWWLEGNERLPVAAREAIRDRSNERLVSAASAWEVATKHRLGKLPEATALVLDFSAAIAGQGFQELPISVEDAIRAGQLPAHHNDPFDRMLIAQALARNIPLISNERVFDRYGVRRLW